MSKRADKLNERLERNNGRVETVDKTVARTAKKSGYEVIDTHLHGEEKRTTVIYKR